MKEKPNYYAIIPADVRYSDKITSLQKLLFGEITSLSNEKGYCWATNNYFANLYGKHVSTISKSIASLSEAGFVRVKVVRDENNRVIERIIKITRPIGEKVKTSCLKSQAPPVKNTKYNTKDNNKKNILFNSWWDLYDKKTGKEACEKKFMKLDINICQKCVDVTPKHVASTQNSKYRRNPLTWLNQGCWDDEIKDSNQEGFTGGGFENFVF
jgi:hypothetical protein